MQKIDFEGLKKALDEMNELSPAQRTGIFNVEIKNGARKYNFSSLKVNGGYNPDLLGFGLNHYGWMNLPMPKTKKSKFHDSEDVSIDLWRNEFETGEYDKTARTLNIKTKSFSLAVNW